MLYPTTAALVPPEIAATLPQRKVLRQALASRIIEVPVGQVLIRAAWNALSIWPDRVTRTYRYGPPLSFKTATGFPFYWIYAADQTHTAVWEAGFCKNPAILPGCFTFDHGAESGLIASLSFDRTLRLFDLSGVAASRMGIYDAQRDIEYDWCQWFGVELDQMLEEYKGEVHGFAYPSRRHPGARAYAISSRVRDALASGLAVDTRQFADTPEYAELLIDPSFVRRDRL